MDCSLCIACAAPKSKNIIHHCIARDNLVCLDVSFFSNLRGRTSEKNNPWGRRSKVTRVLTNEAPKEPLPYDLRRAAVRLRHYLSVFILRPFEASVSPPLRAVVCYHNMTITQSRWCSSPVRPIKRDLGQNFPLNYFGTPITMLFLPPSPDVMKMPCGQSRALAIRFAVGMFGYVIPDQGEGSVSTWSNHSMPPLPPI